MNLHQILRSDWNLCGNYSDDWEGCTCSRIPSCAEVFGKTSSHPGDSAPHSPDLVPCDFRVFPKLKSPSKGKRFQIVDEIQENTEGQLMVTGTTGWGPTVPTLKGTEASLSYIQHFLYLVSSSVNVSISHSTWPGAFWTDLVFRWCVSLVSFDLRHFVSLLLTWCV